tara:strand:- start:182 stop:382 length:201 start_codon:yes stop_codon:yes gene_type:complete
MSGRYHHSHIRLFYSLESEAKKEERKRINKLNVKQRKMIFDFGLTKERFEKMKKDYKKEMISKFSD